MSHSKIEIACVIEERNSCGLYPNGTLFQVPIIGSKHVFMSTSWHMDHPFAIVDSSQFLQLWKNGRDHVWTTRCNDYLKARRTGWLADLRRKSGICIEQNEFIDSLLAQLNMKDPRYEYPLELAYETEANWRAFRKFQYAEAGFAHGRENPVPLALVTCLYSDVTGKPYVVFCNGVTRTVWLLANNAKTFPIYCHSGSNLDILF